MLILLLGQFLTGVLLSFIYVPTTDHAYTTVSFIEKALSSGSWIRSVHHFGSQWLSLLLFVHVVQLFLERRYERNVSHWIFAVLLLACVMAEGATGYSLPWDARAFFSTRVAEGLVGGLPVVGRGLRLWLLGGDQINSLTLSRFFALHVLITPFLIIGLLVWRLLERRKISRNHVTRAAVGAGISFLALSIWSLLRSAPLGPSLTEVSPAYLPRPGAQFLWLYQTLKYIPGAFGSVFGVVFPCLVLGLLFALPWLTKQSHAKNRTDTQRLTGGLVLATLSVLIVAMTTASYVSDRRDSRTREQLARQVEAEKVFLQTPFVPTNMGSDLAIQASGTNRSGNQAPDAYTKFCASCHGANGEGAQQGTLHFPALLGTASKPRRTAADIVALLNDPKSYGLEPPMRSFATKLSDQEKREIADWVVKLK